MKEMEEKGCMNRSPLEKKDKSTTGRKKLQEGQESYMKKVRLTDWSRD
jgi:hypothetical protein